MYIAPSEQDRIELKFVVCIKPILNFKYKPAGCQFLRCIDDSYLLSFHDL